MRKSIKHRIGAGLPAADAATPQPPTDPLPGASVEARARAALTERVQPQPAAPSFEADIKPMFAPYAAAMMWRLDLGSHEAVLANAQTILGRLTSGGDPMPPPPFPPLSQTQIDLFSAWIQAGCLP